MTAERVNTAGRKWCPNTLTTHFRIDIMTIRIDMTALAALITDMREIAETVRTYGSMGKSTIAVQVPSTLYVVAAQMESQMRALVHADHTAARAFSDGQPPNPEPITFDGLRAVPTYPTPSPISKDVKIAELCAAANRLRAVAKALPVAMLTRATPTYVEYLDDAAATITAFADAVD